MAVGDKEEAKNGDGSNKGKCASRVFKEVRIASGRLLQETSI